MSKVLNAGIVGLGHMGRRHATYLSSRPDVSIKAVCSIPLKDAEEYVKADLGGDIRLYDDYRKMLEETALDIIYICLPPYAHGGEVEAAAQKGINIFIEKPIAIDSQRGLSMVKAVEASGVVTQVGYHMRFGSAVRELKRMIEDGTAGKPTLFNARYECNSLHAPWWRDVSKTGGQVLEQVIHMYDMALFLLGRPTHVTGFIANLCHTDVPGYTVEDTSVSCVKFESGALANVSGSNCAIPGEWNTYFTVVCEKVTAYFKSPNEAEFVFTEDSRNEKKIIAKEVDMLAEESDAFIAAVLGKGPQYAPIDEGYLGLRLAEGVKISSEMNGQPVSLKD